MIQLSNGKALAVEEAQRQNCDIDIVLATVDAETSFTNITGDSGNALGYGQVWPLWHMDAFTAAASELGLALPSGMDALRNFTLANDRFSMAVTVKVIKSMWIGANKNWRQFTLSYVGSGIPKWDYDRRLNIWNQYTNNPSNISNAYAYNGSSSGGSASQGNPVSSALVFDTNVPTTSNQVIKNSVQSGNILYGRRYRVIVSNAQGNALNVSQLRCTFRITKVAMMEPNLAEICIYNLNAETENRIINEGNRVIIEAGYEGEQYGLIFDGDVIQPIREKENGTTYKLTLTALDSDRFFNFGVANYSLKKGMSARDQITELTTRAANTAQLGSISENLNDYQLTRGKVVFGLARDYLRQIAQSQNATYYMDDGKVNIVRANDLPKDTIVELSPKSGLIGTPTQVEYGISFKSLLNPRLKLNTFVHIDNSLVREKQYMPNFVNPQAAQGTAQIIRSLDNDGIYRIIRVTHSGDTRGDAWYTECETISQVGLIPTMASSADGKIWG